MKMLSYILLFISSMQIYASTFSAERIEEAVRSFLAQKYSEDYQIDFITKFSEIKIESEDVKAIFDEEHSKYNKSVKLDFVTEDKQIRTQIYHYTAKREVPVFKSKSYIPSGTKITEKMVIQEYDFVEIEKIDDTINPIGRISANPIYSGDMLTSSNTLSDVTIKRGDEIVVIASTGAITIRGMGVALQDGRVGESIRVKRGESKKILTGTINESGELILGE